jgi:hypothetical protein
MNRALKFRVWDNNKKEFLKYPCYFRHDNFEEFTCFDRFFNDKDEDIIIQQFIGLKDNNGKEIYEGDILQSLGIKAKCFWDETGARFLVKRLTDNCNLDFHDRMSIEFEIIGNIFENPELLK